MYFFNYAHVSEEFGNLGFPLWIIYPLAVLKIIGVATLWIKALPSLLREWAYAGMFFNVLLAFVAHVMVSDGEQWGALVALILIVLSRFSLSKIS